MRVICIENSLIIDEGDDKGKIHIHKGSIYHVINSVEGKELRKTSGMNNAPGPWYEFLEIDGLHHYVRFLEIPDDSEDDVEYSIEETKYAKL